MENTELAEKIGYLISKVEDQGQVLQNVVQKVDYLEKTVSEKLTTIETLIKVFKFLGVATVAILTFQFGDISRWWTHFFG